MPRVRIADLAEGMVVHEDVKDSRGRLLFPKGTAISERALRTLKMWGVASVQIVGEGEPEQSVTPDAVAGIRAAMLQRVVNVDASQPLVSRMLDACAHKLASRKTQAGGGA